jgi:hypothetical protein
MLKSVALGSSGAAVAGSLAAALTASSGRWDVVGACLAFSAVSWGVLANAVIIGIRRAQ